MASQHGILLAVNIISDHFGPIVSKVCGCLLRHGALSLQEIVRRLELSPGQVKNSLLILIQHNCVQAYTSPRGGGDKTVTLYLAIFDNVLHRLRFSKFLSVVRADIPESEVLLEGLLQNGRLTFEQLVERTIFKVPEGSPLPTREEIRMNFNKLVYAHYVERCPKPEPFFDPLAVEPTSTRKRAPKTVEPVLSLEQKVVCTAALSDAERFSEIPYFMEGSSSANDDHRAVAGNKRKHEDVEVDEEDLIIAESEVLWRINFERFIFCLKKKFCAERKKAKMRLGTLAIWEAFFEANITNNDNKTVTSPIDGILERVGQKEGGASMTLDQIISVLNDLECTSTTNNPEEFTFDLNKFVETCRNDEVESLVKKKHGQEAYKIFRLLLKQGCPVETDEITDKTILDKQVVHETLYKLWKDEYIDSEVCCINRTHSISSLDKLSTSSFLRFCPFTLELLYRNICHGRLRVYLLQCLQSLTHFNDVKEVCSTGQLQNLLLELAAPGSLLMLWTNIVKLNEWVEVKEDMIIYFGCFYIGNVSYGNQHVMQTMETPIKTTGCTFDSYVIRG